MALRCYDEKELIVRGLDASSQQDAAGPSAVTIRDLLCAQFASFVELLRALFEFAIVEIRESAHGASLTD